MFAKDIGSSAVDVNLEGSKVSSVAPAGFRILIRPQLSINITPPAEGEGKYSQSFDLFEAVEADIKKDVGRRKVINCGLAD